MLLKHTPLTALLCLLITLVACSNEHNEPVIVEKPAAQTESEKANALFERFFEEGVARSPMSQTSLGRKTNMGKWDDISEAFSSQSLSIAKAQLAELLELDVSLLDEATQLSYRLKIQKLEQGIANFKWRYHNYPVNQMFGLHSGVANLLINQHKIDTLADAEAYIARLNALPAFFDELMLGLDKRKELSIIPPKFVFPNVIRDSRNIISGAPFDSGPDSTLLADFKSKIQKLAAQDDINISSAEQTALIKEAESALSQSVHPSYEKLIDYLQTLAEIATDDAGVWKLPDGDEFFNVALKRTTTTTLSAEEIHQIGLAEVDRIHNEMREVRDTIGFEGKLQEFMQAVRNDQSLIYPQTEEGRERYLTEARALIEDMKGRLDSLFLTKPKADIEVRAVEAFREQSAGKAFYQRPSEDGQRPGLFYANLYNMDSMPSYQMAALAYHEGIPGHHMQIAIAQELQDIPKFRKFGGYTAYSEGWGLYSELLPKEIGLYQDPYSDFGRLAMELWRACRLVVDTGIHAKKWTREEGIAYYVANTPNAELDAMKMVERHIVMPSQATAYKVGMLTILKVREKAKQQLGDQFDIREFHDVVLKNGPLPMHILEQQVDDWIKDYQAATGP
ncbi:MAG: DUF885 domain-containing protein [Pseudomonadales bacterium]